MFSLFFAFVFMYYFCENYYKPITVQYYIASCDSQVPRLTLLDLQAHSWDETPSYVGDLLWLVYPVTQSLDQSEMCDVFSMYIRGYFCVCVGVCVCV